MRYTQSSTSTSIYLWSLWRVSKSGRVDANRTLEEYKNFNETFNSAYIGHFPLKGEVFLGEFPKKPFSLIGKPIIQGKGFLPKRNYP